MQTLRPGPGEVFVLLVNAPVKEVEDVGEKHLLQLVKVPAVRVSRGKGTCVARVRSKDNNNS